MSRTIHYKFGGKCNGCDRGIKHIRAMSTERNNAYEWVRCKECNQVTRLEKAGEV